MARITGPDCTVMFILINTHNTQRAAYDDGCHRLTMVRQGMRVAGVPVGTQHFKRDFLQKVVGGEPAELVRALVPMEDAQASFQTLRL